MKTKILKDKWCGMRKLAKNEIRLSSKSWHIRNPSSINKLYEATGLK